MYHCAQIVTRQQKPKKGKKEGVKQRDKEQMTTFKCGGWLHITITDESNVALVKLKHEDDHIKYWNIDIPDEIQDHVRNNLNLSPTQACKPINFTTDIFLNNLLALG